jgi:RNA polymerase sigma-70 factor (ECF subfamily)
VAHTSVPASTEVEQQFAESFDRLARRLARRFGCSLDDAEDAMQTAFIRLIEHRPEGNIGGWLFTVAKHELFARLRELRRERPEAEAQNLTAADLHDHVEAADFLARLGKLKPQQQRCLALQAFGYSYEEIGEQTGQSFTWVNRHLTEGRRALRKLGA